MALQLPQFPLRALVFLAIAGSFLVPSESFLFFSFARSEVSDLEQRQVELRHQLTEAKNVRDDAESRSLLIKSESDKHLNTLVLLVRQRATPQIATASLSPQSDVALRAEAVERLAEYANHDQALYAALQGYDGANQELLKAQLQFEQTAILIANREEEMRVVTARLHDIMRQSTDQYLVMRAFSLGALGALAAALAALLPGATPETRLPNARTMLSMVFGGIVALVVFALFTTRELSVFANDGATPDEKPDYWRVVILCLIAGAFADRLFAAARERVEHITRSHEGTGGNSPPR